jgi:hypothetical protein
VCAKYPSRHTPTAAPARFESTAGVGAKTGAEPINGAKKFEKFESTAARGRGAAAGTGGVRLTNSEGILQHIIMKLHDTVLMPLLVYTRMHCTTSSFASVNSILSCYQVSVLMRVYTVYIRVYNSTCTVVSE